MELFYELLLTAAATLLAAFLLATLFAANDPPRRTDRAAAAIAEEVAEEERIIKVDEVKRAEGRPVVAPPPEAEGWVEADKAPVVVVAEVEEPESLPEEEGVPMKAVREVRLGAGVEEGEDGGGGLKRPDLTSAAAVTAVGAEASPQVSGAEVVPREVVDVAGLEERTVQDVVVKQHDLGAEVAPVEVLEAGPEKHGVQVIGVTQVLPLETEAVEVKQHNLVAEVAPAQDILDVGLVDKSVQAIEVRPHELDSETALEETLDVVLEKKEDQVVGVKEHELPVGAAPQPVLDVPLADKEELKHYQPVEEAAEVHEEVKEHELPVGAAPQPVLDVPLEDKEELKRHQPVEEAAEVHEEVQSKEEAKLEAHPIDQREELVPEEESVARKIDDVNVSHECSFSDGVVTELPVEAVPLQGLPEDDPEADMEFEEWEGIERSEVEKRFGAAAAFAASGTGAAALSKLDSNVQLQLQGLLKVAIDGPCYDAAQPLTLRPSSRAKWAAWQKLGNMNPEIAMEKYMNLLSETIPGWMGKETSVSENTGSLSAETILTITASRNQQSNQGNEDSSSICEGRPIIPPNPEKGARYACRLNNYAKACSSRRFTNNNDATQTQKKCSLPDGRCSKVYRTHWNAC